jgi:hypothetical protein
MVTKMTRKHVRTGGIEGHPSQRMLKDVNTQAVETLDSHQDFRTFVFVLGVPDMTIRVLLLQLLSTLPGKSTLQNKVFIVANVIMFYYASQAGS